VKRVMFDAEYGIPVALYYSSVLAEVPADDVCKFSAASEVRGLADVRLADGRGHWPEGWRPARRRGCVGGTHSNLSHRTPRVTPSPPLPLATPRASDASSRDSQL